MEACRKLLNVPDDEVLYQTIKELIDEKNELQDRVNHLEKHPPNCECRECKI
jgi:hypothetical protein